MSRVFATKIPEYLLVRLEETSQREHKSKGALIRKALENFFEGEQVEQVDQISRITEAHFHNKKLKISVNWGNIYKKAALSHPHLTPEEEVTRVRRRGV